jgi:hypothetical protein
MKRKQFPSGHAVFPALVCFTALVLAGCPAPVTVYEDNGTVGISGIPKVYKMLTAEITELRGDGDVSFQWQISSEKYGIYDNIRGATGPVYIPAPADEGKYIKVLAARSGFSVNVYSESVGPIAKADPQLKGTVDISGAAEVGAELAALISELQGVGEPGFQWQSSDSKDGIYSDISGAVNDKYIPVAGDEGRYLKVTVTREGYSGGVSSEPKGPVELPQLTGSVSISETANVDDELTADTSELQGEGEIGFQWQKKEGLYGTYIDIEGATGPAYTPVTDDKSRYIQVVVTRGGYRGSVTSNSAGPVNDAPVRVISVTVSGPESVALGEKGKYSALVTVTPDWASNKFVMWTIVEENKNSQTRIDYSGELTVAADETLTEITVRASSTAGKETKYGEITVAITASQVIWTQVTDAAFDDSSITAIAFGGGHFVAVAADGKAAYSQDGISWTKVTDPKFTEAFTYYYEGDENYEGYEDVNSVNAIAYGSGKFIAVGGGGGQAAWSANGVDWTPFTVPVFVDGEFSDPIFCIAYGNSGNDIFVAAGYGGKAAYSTDGGVSWKPAITGPAFGNSSIRSIAYGGGKFVAVGENGKVAWSTNGLIWTAAKDATTFGSDGILSIAYGGGKFVAGTWQTNSAWSPGALTWSKIDYGYPGFASFNAIAFGGEGGKAKFVAVGREGGAVFLQDTSWRLTGNTTFGSNEINGIAYGNGRFVAVGDNGKIAYSNPQE